MKVGGIIARWIFILCLPVLLLAASIAWGFNSLWIYTYGFQKSNVSLTTGLSPAQLDTVGRDMINYFNNGDEFVQITTSINGQSVQLFSPDEQMHLRNVKQLVWLDYRILLITLILALGYALAAFFWHRGQYRRMLARSLVWGGSLALVVILLMGIGTLVDFDQLWLEFHFLAFTDNLWSVPGYMVQLFAGIFYYAILFTVSFMAGLALLIGIPSVVYLRLTRRRVPTREAVPE